MEKTIEEKNLIKMDKSVNPEAVHELLVQGLGKIKTVENQDIVLVIGNTGVGKSTSINYFMGHGMTKSFSETYSKKVVDIDPKYLSSRNAKINHSHNYCTPFPEAFNANNSLVFCDCPGFGDTRTPEEKVVVSLSTEIAIKKARSVKAVIVLISYNHLTDDKGTSFRKIYKTLSKLFKDLSNIPILYLINRAPKEIQVRGVDQTVLRQVDDYIKSIEIKLKDLCPSPEGEGQTQSHSMTGYLWHKTKVVVSGAAQISKSVITGENREELDKESEKIKNLCAELEVLQSIKKNKDNILFLDVFNFNSRESIFEKLLTFDKPVSINQFNFGSYDKDRNLFNQYVYESIGNLTPLLKNSAYTAKVLKEKEEFIHALQHNSKQKTLEEAKKIHENTVLDVIETHKQIKNLDSLLDEINHKLSYLEDPKEQEVYDCFQKGRFGYHIQFSESIKKEDMDSNTLYLSLLDKKPVCYVKEGEDDKKVIVLTHINMDVVSKIQEFLERKPNALTEDIQNLVYSCTSKKGYPPPLKADTLIPASDKKQKEPEDLSLITKILRSYSRFLFSFDLDEITFESKHEFTCLVEHSNSRVINRRFKQGPPGYYYAQNRSEPPYSNDSSSDCYFAVFSQRAHTPQNAALIKELYSEEKIIRMKMGDAVAKSEKLSRNQELYKTFLEQYNLSDNNKVLQEKLKESLFKEEAESLRIRLKETQEEIKSLQERLEILKKDFLSKKGEIEIISMIVEATGPSTPVEASFIEDLRAYHQAVLLPALVFPCDDAGLARSPESLIIAPTAARDISISNAQTPRPVPELPKFEKTPKAFNLEFEIQQINKNLNKIFQQMAAIEIQLNRVEKFQLGFSNQGQDSKVTSSVHASSFFSVPVITLSYEADGKKRLFRPLKDQGCQALNFCNQEDFFKKLYESLLSLRDNLRESEEDLNKFIVSIKSKYPKNKLIQNIHGDFLDSTADAMIDILNNLGEEDLENQLLSKKAIYLEKKSCWVHWETFVNTEKTKSFVAFLDSPFDSSFWPNQTISTALVSLYTAIHRLPVCFLKYGANDLNLQVLSQPNSGCENSACIESIIYLLEDTDGVLSSLKLIQETDLDQERQNVSKKL